MRYPGESTPIFGCQTAYDLSATTGPLAGARSASLPYTYLLAKEVRNAHPLEKNFRQHKTRSLNVCWGNVLQEFGARKNFRFRATKFLEIFLGITRGCMCQAYVADASSMKVSSPGWGDGERTDGSPGCLRTWM